jgi:superfamily I DNA/RNA helicase
LLTVEAYRGKRGDHDGDDDDDEDDDDDGWCDLMTMLNIDSHSWKVVIDYGCLFDGI